MKILDPNWLTEGLIDFEYKKYVLLAYFKGIQEEFQASKLYPYLSDLIFHYQNLQNVKEHKKIMYQRFPRKISKADFEKLHLEYENLIQDDEIMEELESIISFALPNFKSLLVEGKSIYEYIEQNLEFLPVGISPLYQEEGYLMLHEELLKTIQVYYYQVSIFTNIENSFRAIHLQYLETMQKGFFETFENLKIQLLRKYKQMPNPATFLVNAKLSYPLQETLLPLAKRILIKHISQSAA
ncbi:MAG: hypothetical protein MUC49_10305 [Raineya sp.]|jgi:hypothetical protein|nr:hypothetical protein [Raineya sp.]